MIRFHGYMDPRARIRIKRPLIDWRNPLESSAVCCLVIGLCVLGGMLVGVL